MELGWSLQAEKESMQKMLVTEQYQADRAKAAENEIKAKVLKLEKDYEEEVERTSDIM